MGKEVDKLFLEVAGRPVVAHTWQRFDEIESIDEIILVVRDGMQSAFSDLAARYQFEKRFHLVAGGKERQDSVWNGLQALPSATEIVAIQDAARPCTTEALIAATIEAARQTGAAVAAQPVTDTIKESRDGDLIERTLDRSRLWAVQTPQTFRLDIILRAVFGVDEGARFSRIRERIVRFLAQADGPAAAFLAIRSFQIELRGLTPWGRFVRDREAIRAELVAEIARRRSEGTEGRTDILSMLVEARDEQGEPMTDAELIDEMFTLLMAGHETTATSLAWVFHHVLDRPDVLAKLRAELGRVVGDGPVEAQHVPQLEYLDAVLKESQRLTPVATNVIRRLTGPMRIAGRDLPAGITVSACIYATHRRPDLWPEPERFDPERFVGARPAPYTFFPFGGGIRRCIGAAFATYEMKIVLAQVLSRVELGSAPGYRMRPVLRTITIAPSGGMPVVAERRR